MNEDLFNLGIKALIINKEGKILLLKANTAKFKTPQPIHWDIPGGRIHRGSNIEETLKREVAEETGIKDIKAFRSFSMAVANYRIPFNESDIGLILWTFICDVEDQIEIKISGEHLAYSWFSPQEASKLLQFKYPKEFTEKISELT